MALLKALVNGDFSSGVSVNDRGLNYGDGAFETIAYTNGNAVFWERHYKRLKKGCDILGFDCPIENDLLKDIKKITETDGSTDNAVIKIIVTRGESERGYKPSEHTTPNVIVSLSAYPLYPSAYWKDGVDIKKCTTNLSSQKKTSGIKHLNRIDQVLARREWDDEFQEGLMLNENGHVIEAVMSNVFIVEDKKIVTPIIKGSGVKGIMREVVLNICETSGIMVLKDKLTLERVLKADEVFLTNSLIGIWPVKRIENTQLEVGSLTQEIMQSLKNKYMVNYASLSL